MNNDVLASLEMMLTFGQMMLCLTAQMKKSNSYELDFLAEEKGFEPLRRFHALRDFESRLFDQLEYSSVFQRLL